MASKPNCVGRRASQQPLRGQRAREGSDSQAFVSKRYPGRGRGHCHEDNATTTRGWGVSCGHWDDREIGGAVAGSGAEEQPEAAAQKRCQKLQTTLIRAEERLRLDLQELMRRGKSRSVTSQDCFEGL